MSLIFALICYLCWGTGDIFGTIASRKIGSYNTTFWYSFIDIIVFAPFSLLFLGSLPRMMPPILALNLLLGVIGTIGLLTFYQGLKIGSPSVVGTIAAAFVAITPVLSVLFLGERISLSQGLAIGVSLLGIVVMGLDFKAIKNLKIDRAIFLAVCAMLLWGVYWAFIKIPVQQLGWFWPSMISTATFPVLLIFMRLTNTKLEKPTKNGAFLPLAANALLLGVGAFSFNVAISRGLTAIVTPISGSYATLFVFLSFLVFKGKISRQQIIGISITLIGIVLISIFSA